MVAILMMSAKLATLDLFKIKAFWNKGYYVIISVYSVTYKASSRDSNYTVHVVILPKFDDSSCGWLFCGLRPTFVEVTGKNMEIRLSVAYFVNDKAKHSEPFRRYDNFFCFIFPLKKFLREKFLISVTLYAFVKYLTTNSIIKTMHSNRIPFGSDLINLTRESSRTDHEFIGIQLIVCTKVIT